MLARRGLLEELEQSLPRKSIHQRVEALRRVTDLFATGAAAFSEEQVDLFDEVMSRLLKEVNEACRAALSVRLLELPNAPTNTSRALALDDSIETAGPLLSYSNRLSDDTLVEGAKTKSQRHLLAISKRSSLAEAVTDVLVERGDQEVLLSTSENRGAQFSENGLSTLVHRAGSDEKLVLSIWQRPEIPRQHLLHLLDQASDTVRRRLETIDPRKIDLLRGMVGHAASQIQADVRERSPNYSAIRDHLKELYSAGRLGCAELDAFAIAGKFDETSVVLSMMCDLPIELVERALVREKPDQILVLAKAIELPWQTTRALVMLSPTSSHMSSIRLENIQATYAKILEGTARKAIQFYRLKERAVGNLAISWR
jgi:uncharacterized protein (DUF2336 family)